MDAPPAKLSLKWGQEQSRNTICFGARIATLFHDTFGVAVCLVTHEDAQSESSMPQMLSFRGRHGQS
jgi:hypothetical protein